MSLFDEIRVDDFWLPDALKGKNLVFQTKDLECYLHTYKITKDGQLILTSRPGKPGDATRVVSENIDFTGAVYFYTDIKRELNAPKADWHQFCAIFKNGNVIQVLGQCASVGFSKKPESKEIEVINDLIHEIKFALENIDDIEERQLGRYKLSLAVSRAEEFLKTQNAK